MREEQAKVFYETRFWEDMSYEERARFQLFQKRLCMPFGVFQEAVEKTLGRAVSTDEFARPEGLRAELLGKRPARTEEVMRLRSPAPADLEEHFENLVNEFLAKMGAVTCSASEYRGRLAYAIDQLQAAILASEDREGDDES